MGIQLGNNVRGVTDTGSFEQDWRLDRPAERTTSLRACTTVVAPSALAISAPDATTFSEGRDVNPNIWLMVDGVGQHLEI